MKKFSNIKKSLGHDGELNLRITSIKFEDNDALISIQAVDIYSQDDLGCWDIRAMDLIAHELSDIGGEFNELEDGDVLIKELLDKREQLFLSSSAESPFEVVGRLYSAHLNSVSDWIPFGKYFNSCCRLDSVLQDGYGLLADGPRFLIDSYEEVLHEVGLKVSRGPLRPSKLWDGSKWNEIDGPVLGLTIGKSYFLAKSFIEVKRG